MRMILAVHMPAAVTIPLALIVAGWIMWYWQRLGRREVPDTRRRIRRASIIVMLVSLPILVRGLSFLDHDTDHSQYIITWLLVLFTLGLVVVTAGIDLVNTLRIERKADRQRVAKAVTAFGKAAKTAGATTPDERSEKGNQP
ncbi:MAG: hypothetical protein IH830_00425 [Planctomycetes bacterium]|nr:hypothetical protein [Planctomycetota bacterium]